MLAACAIICTEMWDYHHTKPGVDPNKITAIDVLIGLITAAFPIFNIIVFLAGVYYFINKLKE